MKFVDIAVIGSGPGGAITAALLAESGREVVLLERAIASNSLPSKAFTIDEMMQKYYRSGMTVAFGNPKISYIEGSCLGGGSEINSGLYHRTPQNVIDQWSNFYKVKDLSHSQTSILFEKNEIDLSVCYMPPDKIPLASLKLHYGAQALGWESLEVPRWFIYEKSGLGIKQSMTRTFLPRALSSGVVIQDGVEVTKLIRSYDYWLLNGVQKKINCRENFKLKAKHVFLCGGAISTPLLLIKSGISKLAGRTLQMHPTVKLVARFEEKINSIDMGVPVHQVKEFSPRIGLGCSISTPPYLQLAMLDVPMGVEIVRQHWQNMAIYYAMVCDGLGSIIPLPFSNDPFIRFSLGESGVRALKEGLFHLGRCLFEAGAIELYPSVIGSQRIRTLDELNKFIHNLSTNNLNPMTVHLFSSCPMGEVEGLCVTNSYGKVFDHENLFINDASMLCTSMGVNPQGTLMMLARRNIEKFIEAS